MITLTEKAETYIGNQIDSRENSIGIRFGVTGAGCGGYSYVIEFVDVADKDDRTFEQNGITIYVDPKSLILLMGSQVDYVSDLMSSGLEFSNPMASTHCGCGESFTL